VPVLVADGIASPRGVAAALVAGAERVWVLRGRFLLRPLEEPLRTGHARRGGGSVDEEGGRLRRPGLAPAHSCASPSIVLVMPVQCAPPGRGDASVPPPRRSTPAPMRLAGALQKPHLHCPMPHSSMRELISRACCAIQVLRSLCSTICRASSAFWRRSSGDSVRAV